MIVICSSFVEIVYTLALDFSLIRKIPDRFNLAAGKKFGSW